MSPWPLGRRQGNQKGDRWHISSFKKIAKPLSPSRRKPGTAVSSQRTECTGPIAWWSPRWGHRHYVLLPGKDTQLAAQAFPFPEPKKTKQSCFVTVHRNTPTDGKLNLLSVSDRVTPHRRPCRRTTKKRRSRSNKLRFRVDLGTAMDPVSFSWSSVRDRGFQKMSSSCVTFLVPNNAQPDTTAFPSAGVFTEAFINFPFSGLVPVSIKFVGTQIAQPSVNLA